MHTRPLARARTHTHTHTHLCEHTRTHRQRKHGTFRYAQSHEHAHTYGQPRLNVRSHTLLEFGLTLALDLILQEVETLERIGQGQCAEVYKVKWRGTYAVSKVLKRAENYKAGWTLATARADLVHEISVLSHLRHPNLGTKPYPKEIPRHMCIYTQKSAPASTPLCCIGCASACHDV